MKFIRTQIELMHDLSILEQNTFWDNYIEQAMEANGLQYGGSLSGVIEPESKDLEIAEKHKKIVECWLEGQVEVKSFELNIYDEDI